MGFFVSVIWVNPLQQNKLSENFDKALDRKIDLLL
jgi:hypothetical protein